MNESPSSQSLVLCDHDEADINSRAIAGGWVVACSVRCPSSEGANEDAAIILPVDDKTALLAVADGVGGSRAGDRASAIAVQSLKSAVAATTGQRTSMRTAILNGIDQANDAVQAMGVGSHTTLAAIELHGAKVRPYHVGDSMILVVGQRGKIKLQTICHSPVGFAVESGLLDETEAMHHKDRHLVSNLVGTPDMRIEIGAPLDLAPRDTLLLASDGLFDNLHVEEIVDRIRKGPLDEAVKDLATRARARMMQPEVGQPSKPDDLTILGYRPLPPPKAANHRPRRRAAG